MFGFLGRSAADTTGGDAASTTSTAGMSSNRACQSHYVTKEEETLEMYFEDITKTPSSSSRFGHTYLAKEKDSGTY